MKKRPKEKEKKKGVTKEENRDREGKKTEKRKKTRKGKEKASDKSWVPARWVGDAEGPFIEPKAANIHQMGRCYPTPKLMFYGREE